MHISKLQLRGGASKRRRELAAPDCGCKARRRVFRSTTLSMRARMARRNARVDGIDSGSGNLTTVVLSS
jgi:hypothetical protein